MPGRFVFLLEHVNLLVEILLLETFPALGYSEMFVGKTAPHRRSKQLLVSRFGKGLVSEGLRGQL
jgi:hypothetical protein